MLCCLGYYELGRGEVKELSVTKRMAARRRASGEIAQHGNNEGCVEHESDEGNNTTSKSRLCSIRITDVYEDIPTKRKQDSESMVNSLQADWRMRRVPPPL